MALADRLKEIDSVVNNKKCVYILLVESMTKVEQQALQDAWDKGLSQRTILRALRAEGYKTSNEAIYNHKSGNCKCLKA